MSELALMKLLWSISTLFSCISVCGSLWILKSYERSLTILTQCFTDMIENYYGDKHGTGIPRMAEDTEVAE